MPLWPDILVTEKDSYAVLLVVSVKAVATDADEAELKLYMASSDCYAGMLVTLQATRFYRNRYTEYGPNTVAGVGECPTARLLPTVPGMADVEWHLIERVEIWLETLRRVRATDWPSEVRDAIEQTALPAVLEGVVQVTGSRLRKTGS
jgi:hypothetical protein